jgi:hypothetical protein
MGAVKTIDHIVTSPGIGRSARFKDPDAPKSSRSSNRSDRAATPADRPKRASLNSTSVMQVRAVGACYWGSPWFG